MGKLPLPQTPEIIKDQKVYTHDDQVIGKVISWVEKKYKKSASEYR